MDGDDCPPGCDCVACGTCMGRLYMAKLSANNEAFGTEDIFHEGTLVYVDIAMARLATTIEIVINQIEAGIAGTIRMSDARTRRIVVVEMGTPAWDVSAWQNLALTMKRLEQRIFFHESTLVYVDIVTARLATTTIEIVIIQTEAGIVEKIRMSDAQMRRIVVVEMGTLMNKEIRITIGPINAVSSETSSCYSSWISKGDEVQL